MHKQCLFSALQTHLMKCAFLFLLTSSILKIHLSKTNTYFLDDSNFMLYPQLYNHKNTTTNVSSRFCYPMDFSHLSQQPQSTRSCVPSTNSNICPRLQHTIMKNYRSILLCCSYLKKKNIFLSLYFTLNHLRHHHLLRWLVVGTKPVGWNGEHSAHELKSLLLQEDIPQNQKGAYLQESRFHIRRYSPTDE